MQGLGTCAIGGYGVSTLTALPDVALRIVMAFGRRVEKKGIDTGRFEQMTRGETDADHT